MKFSLALLILLISLSSGKAEESFLPVDGPNGGQVISVTIGDNNDLWITTSLTGILKSTNGGKEWVAKNKTLESYSLSKCVFDSEGNIYTSNWMPYQMFRSSDGGETWIDFSYNLSTSKSFYSSGSYPLIIPGPEQLYMKYESSSIYKFDEDNKRWEILFFIKDIPNTDYISKFFVDSRNNLFLVLTTREPSRYVENVYRSGDGGETWQKLDFFTDSYAVSMIEGIDGTLFASSRKTFNVSYDGGLSWDRTSWIDHNENVYNLRKDHDHNIWVIYENAFYKYSYTTKSWDKIVNSPFDYIRDYEIGKDGNIYAVTRNGIEKIEISSGDNESINGNLKAFGTHKFYLAKDKTLYMLCDLGIYKSKDYDKNWELCIENGDDDGAIMQNVFGEIFASVPGSVKKSIDNGNSWKELPKPNSRVNDFEFIDDIVFASTMARGVYKSTNGGYSWNDVNKDFPLVFGDQVNTEFLTLDPEGNIIVGLYNNGYYISKDKGDNWEMLSAQTDGYWPIELLFDSEGNYYSICVVGCSSKSCNYSPIIKSTDGGNSWFPAYSGINTRYVRSMAIAPGGDLFAGTMNYKSGGVYISRDKANSWELIPSEYAKNDIQSIAVLPDGRIIIGVEGDGMRISKNPVSITSIDEDENEDRISLEHKAYYIPRSDEIKIDYTLEKDADVLIELFDMSGKNLYRTDNRLIRKGENSEKISANSLQSGVYIYTIIVDGEINSGKVTVTK